MQQAMARRSSLRSLLATLAAVALALPASAQDAPPAPVPAADEAPAVEAPAEAPDEDGDEQTAPAEPSDELPGLEGTGAPAEPPPADAPAEPSAPPPAEGAPPPPPSDAPEQPGAEREPAPPPEPAEPAERPDLVPPVEGGQMGGGKTTVEGQAASDQVNVQQTGPAGWLESFLGSGEHPKFTVGVSGGYALRMHEDDRTHGGGLTGFVDVPLAYGFGAQFAAYGQGWIPSEKAPDPLGLLGAAGSLIYAFDDTDAVAWVGIGPTAAVGIVSDTGTIEFIPHAGALLSFGVRFPLRAPIYVWDPTNGLNLNLPIGTSQVTNPSPSLFPTQVLMTAGLNFEPFSFMDAMADHGNITKAILPSWLLFGSTDKAGKKDVNDVGASPKPQKAPADDDNKPSSDKPAVQ
jgi:hypothetical protein